MKLNIGCAHWVEPGWIGIDRDSQSPDVLKLDVRGGLPYQPGTVDLIYCEDFIEHLTRTEGIAFLKECFRVLKPSGVLRVATPDLTAQVQRYLDGVAGGEFLSENMLDFNRQKTTYDWETAPPGTYAVNYPCEQMNILFYWWGHQWVYDEEYLTKAMLAAGFSATRCAIGVSAIPELCNMERRKTEAQLVVEGVHP